MASKTLNLYREAKTTVIPPTGSSTTSVGTNFLGQYQYSTSFPLRRRPRGFLSPTSVSATDNDGYINLYSSWYSTYKATVTGKTFIQSGGQRLGVVSGNASFDADLVSRAELKALLQLKNQNVNLAVSFAERAQTAALVADTATTLAEAFSAMRSLNVRKMKKILGLGPVNKRDRRILKKAGPKEKKARDLWLSYNYGFVPLMSDVYGSASQLAQHDANVPDRYRAIVRSRISKRSRTSLDNFYDNPVVHTRTQVFTEVSQGASCTLVYCLENPVSAEAAQLGFTNPLSVAWELVPYSFVADWFYPIGNYINALDANVGWRFLGGSCSRRLSQVTRISGDISGFWPNYSNRVGGGRGVHKYRTFSRTVYTASPVPDLVKPSNPFNGRRMMNALALLSSATR